MFRWIHSSSFFRSQSPVKWLLKKRCSSLKVISQKCLQDDAAVATTFEPRLILHEIYTRRRRKNGSVRPPCLQQKNKEGETVRNRNHDHLPDLKEKNIIQSLSNNRYSLFPKQSICSLPNQLIGLYQFDFRTPAHSYSIKKAYYIFH